jgi:hypothetical protein
MTNFQSTTPGYKNKHGQVFIYRTGFPLRVLPQARSSTTYVVAIATTTTVLPAKIST